MSVRESRVCPVQRRGDCAVVARLAWRDLAAVRPGDMTSRSSMTES